MLTAAELLSVVGGSRRAYAAAVRAWEEGAASSTFVDAVLSVNPSTVAVIGRRMRCPWCSRQHIRLQASRNTRIPWGHVRDLCAACGLTDARRAMRRPASARAGTVPGEP